MTQVPFLPRLNPDFVARALNLPVPGVLQRPQLPFTGLITDSRKIQPGCLFIALKGEKFDGHDFIDAAITQGARGILCRRGVTIASHKDLCVFSVEDTLTAYRRLAAAWRKEFSIPVIAVAGSVGKTTTKELLAAILQGRWSKVLKTQGSQNGFVGVPMSLLELRPEHGAAVIEIGIDEVGAMNQHMTLVGATASVLTAIGPEHLENLRDIPTVAREEGYALSSVAQSGGLVAINLDDPWIRPHQNILRVGRKVAYTLGEGTPSHELVTGKLNDDGTSLEVSGIGLTGAKFTPPLFGRHNAANLLAAVAIAAGLGLTEEQIRTGLATFKGATGRSELRELPGPTQVLCDYYNASPPSMEAGLELLNQISRTHGKTRKRWVCLGDMLELGPDEEKFHRALAGKIMELGIENVLLYGPRMAALFEELKARGFPGNLTHFDTHQDLVANLTRSAEPGEAIMIKGSRSMRMEEVWNALEPFAQANWSKSVESGNPSPHA